jgi:hypothetical protein
MLILRHDCDAGRSLSNRSGGAALARRRVRPFVGVELHPPRPHSTGRSVPPQSLPDFVGKAMAAAAAVARLISSPGRALPSGQPASAPAECQITPRAARGGAERRVPI